MSSSEIYRLNPLADRRWPAFLSERPDSSVFHSVGWLKALQLTYGYEPVVFTTTPPGRDLTNGIVCCAISSWLTGRRLVSLPFSDHCQPLVSTTNDLRVLTDGIRPTVDSNTWRYLELRPESEQLLGGAKTCLSQSSDAAYLHRLDLRPDVEMLRSRLHKNSMRRNIDRAERASLIYEEGASDSLLKQFYRLLVITRRRHLIPPQPLAWFQNLAACLGRDMKISVFSKDGQPFTAIMTLSHKSTVTYKYGCSDPAFRQLGGSVLLLWRAILDAKASGAEVFDLGRTEAAHDSLLVFKDRWGAMRTSLRYYRYPATRSARVTGGGRGRHVAGRVLARMPDAVLKGAGRLLYKHVG